MTKSTSLGQPSRLERFGQPGQPGQPGRLGWLRWSGWAMAGAAGLAGAVLLHVWAPPAGPHFVVCLFRRLTGLPCPGCGLTRSWAHLAKGEWSAALRDHPLGPLLAAELAAAWLLWGRSAGVLGGGDLRRRANAELAFSVDRLAMWNLAAFAAVWICRLATGTLPW